MFAAHTSYGKRHARRLATQNLSEIKIKIRTWNRDNGDRDSKKISQKQEEKKRLISLVSGWNMSHTWMQNENEMRGFCLLQIKSLFV